MSAPAAPKPRALSRSYAAAPYRSTWADQPAYSPVNATDWCEECRARGHEAAAPRRVLPATIRREFPFGASALLLCAPHAEAWHERDTEDMSVRRVRVP